MKKNLPIVFLLFAFAVLVPMRAHAWNGAKDERVQPPCIEVAEPTMTASEVKKVIKDAVDGVKNGLTGKKGALTNINNQLAAVIVEKNKLAADAISATDQLKALTDKEGALTMIREKQIDLDDQFKALTDKKGALTVIKEKQDELHEELVGENGEFVKIGRAIRDVDSTLFWATLLVIIAIIVSAFFNRRLLRSIRADVNSVGLQVHAVHNAVNDVPRQVKALDPMVIDLPDIGGRHFIYTPPIVDGEYVELCVPKTVTVAVTNPNNIVRTSTDKKADVRNSTRQALIEFVKNTIPGAPAPKTEQDRQELALITHLLKLSYGNTTGELMEITV